MNVLHKSTLQSASQAIWSRYVAMVLLVRGYFIIFDGACIL